MNTKIQLVSFQDILNAKHVIQNSIHKTPLISSMKLDETLGTQLYLKAELFQKMGSFKLRGVLNKLQSLSNQEKSNGVVTISAGNHAQSLAYACKNEGIRAVIVMPSYSAKNKIETTRSLGAEVIVHEDSRTLLERLNTTQTRENLTLVHPFDDLSIIAGQGTIGLEIFNDLKSIPDVVIVPVGGGGLISGIAAAIKLKHPEVKVIGVEPLGAAAMYESLKKNEVISLEKINTIADGLAAPFAGQYTLAHAQKFVDKIVLVSDEEIIDALRLLLLKGKLVCEPAGAAGIAALMANKISISDNLNVVCVLSGGNIDNKLLKQVINET